MSRLSDLLRAAKQLDPQLGEDLETEIRPLQERLPFGLNFERHAPEAVELPGHRIRKTSKVRVLPPRGSAEQGDQRLWTVDMIDGDTATITSPNGAGVETVRAAIEDLVLVAEFRDRIYPGLRPDATVQRGGNKPFHTVINGENFHVLEQLTFTHERSVDAIYIDPPYNSGARDWKYNNNYVADDDLYRHSKWLAFMERRLKLAKRLLKPEDSVLIVTIDEKEYLRLGLLLEQTFPEAEIQVVSSLINPAASARPGSFGRVDEYIYFVRMGAAAAGRVLLSREWVSAKGRTHTGAPRWDMLRRSGGGARRQDSPGGFYPIYVEPAGPRVAEVGAPLPPGVSVPDPIEGTVPVLPIRKDGTEGRWMWSKQEFERRLAQGRVRISGNEQRGFVVSILKDGEYAKIVDGEYTPSGRGPDGSLRFEKENSDLVRATPGTQWRISSHDATQYGSRLLRDSFLPGREFPFPKSLYAVEDTLRFFVHDKTDAVILDFFSGSGTTAHAVMRLNKQDGGHRQCISVTNNEVSADEQTRLLRQGLRPGDPEWEELGICDHITKPRIQAAITGLTPEGKPITGDYKFVDEFPMADGLEENAAFFTLTYESKWLVGVDRAFAAIAPMLWLRAGATGSRIDSIEGGWAFAESYGILRDLDDSAAFVEAIRGREGIRIAYIVTDDEGRYQQVADEIHGIETVRLYEDYLRNCEMTGDF
ncbi:site-specific DNA-methyltransferase [Aeromicrobium piscarium]|uniref:Site-specific DNA-methyltransferase n=1 Tax=Aeromicrobium piscarium TaxID=2590901 RepID=A0A554RKA6_9ACTN|nr:DNA methyltransferase [Aeromicrobium piscarium]TSD54529.1 site-specific DNA-methyltransferase [Aeromicrobium piscarium]